MLLAAFFLFASAQSLPPISAASDYAHLTSSIIAPRLIHATDPEYTKLALDEQIQGSVVLQAVIGVDGRVTNASVLSPLPAGLDEKALEAVKNWRYVAGVMDTVDIPVLTTIDVVFRLPYDPKRLPPHLPAASSLEQSARRGDDTAELKLADQYESQRNFDDAKVYFRLCAADRNATCEFRLGNLLVTGPDINPNDFAQGVAWLELARDHGNPQAAALLPAAAAKLSSIQRDWVVQVKPHLEHKR